MTFPTQCFPLVILSIIPRNFVLAWSNVTTGAYTLSAVDKDSVGASTRSDLSTWVSLCINVVTDGALRFVDPEALQHSRRFYRIVPQSNYVPEE